MKFSDYHFHEKTTVAISKRGFSVPTEIQKQVIGLILENKNLIAQAETGTGKTHAFLIPLAEKLNSRAFKKVLIITPTRELGMQIAKEAKEFNPLSCFYEKDERALETKAIIVTTLKKAVLLFNQNAALFKSVDAVVFDEADMILLNDEKDTENFFLFLKSIQVLFFSATISVEIKKFLKKFFPNLYIVRSKVSNKNLQNYFLLTTEQKLNNDLLTLLKTFTPLTCLIFCSTQKEAEALFKALSSEILGIKLFSGKLSLRERSQILDELKSAKLKYLITTDLIARGIDIHSISHVINYSLPSEFEYFFHRIGRCSRFKAKGVSYTFIKKSDTIFLNYLKEVAFDFRFVKIKSGEITPLEKTPFTRTLLNEKMRDEERFLRSTLPLPKKVKPNYKKRRQEKIKKLLNKQKRAFISKKYNERKER